MNKILSVFLIAGILIPAHHLAAADSIYRLKSQISKCKPCVVELKSDVWITGEVTNINSKTFRISQFQSNESRTISYDDVEKVRAAYKEENRGLRDVKAISIVASGVYTVLLCLAPILYLLGNRE